MYTHTCLDVGCVLTNLNKNIIDMGENISIRSDNDQGKVYEKAVPRKEFLPAKGW